ncbi:substrate-binding domain-containing protein [Pseudanabaena sp. FACHB-2040]|uniref:substrate-binding domain-containing protein n=1 Tax=Pseudanabaena sp. FACHB-2040 TaxID=2692859 RepID=UPI001684A50B|nr:substrate-binding domain-containing protein [Pseudanabaena sp. FACHB-2040]MBD2258733.1 substrate-binding domain-containing protein [Pseudanabaena sp. FACHB-2040]
MTQKNDIPALVFSLLTTLALLGGGIWWFIQRSDLDLGSLRGGNPASTPAGAGTTSPTASPTTLAESFSQVANVPSGLFNYGGSTTWAPVRGEVDPALQTVWPRFQLRYTEPLNSAPGSGSGIAMLINNQLSFAQSSRPLETEEYQAAQSRGFTLTEIPIAIEGIAIAVNPDLAVQGLTIAQLKEIYTGRITNWNQVGGPNLPLVPYSRSAEGGTVQFFQESVLGGDSFGSNVRTINTTTEALRAVAANPGGIYYASAPEVVGQCTTKPLPIGRQGNEIVPPYQEPLVSASDCPNRRNQLNREAIQTGSYPLTRRLFVIVRNDGSVDQQAGEAYANLLLADQGQDLMVKAGFVRIR